MRIATGGFSHETNSFSNILVTMDVLKKDYYEGDSLYKAFEGVKNYCGGFIDEAKALDVELIPTLQCSMRPSGSSTREVLELARDRLVELLCMEYEKQPYDAIALCMHGAGAAEGYPDVEGEILTAIRTKLGNDIPIGVVLDLHGNISPEMVELSDLLIGCKHYPHIDSYDVGRTMFRLLVDMVEKGYRPHKRLVKLPWHMVPAEGVTTSGPAYDVQQLCFAKEEEDNDLIDASYFHGFPYADVPMCSVSVVTMAKTQEAADRNALDIARYAWNRRRDFAVPLNSAEEAVEQALQMGEGPILIHESSDNPGGGTPGDGTYLLRELLKRNVPSAFGYICDPEVAEQAAQAGVGAHIRCRLGGKTDAYHGEPIELEDAYVKCISDGSFIRKSPMSFGARNSLGTTVCLVVGNVQIVVGTARSQTFDEGPFRIAGVDWPELRIVAMKSAQHFKGWWASRVKGIVSCESPGMQTANLSLLPLKHADTSYYPLQDAQWNR